jgi:hypothetical protein
MALAGKSTEQLIIIALAVCVPTGVWTTTPSLYTMLMSSITGRKNMFITGFSFE